MIVLLPFFLAASLPPPQCHRVDRPTVLAADVARVIPAFSQLPDDFLIGYVQESGAPKVFQGADLERIARNRGLDLHGLGDVCFARRTFVPGAAEIAEAMKKTLAIDGVKIEILSSIQRAIPAGEIVFPRSGVEPFTGPETIWHGYVGSSEGAKFPITVRARITATLNRIVAVSDLPSRKPIQPGQLRIESSEDSPLDDGAVRQMDQAAGFLAKARIPKGTALRKSQIERPMDVAFGDLVRVDVFEGAAHLSLEARAETSGMKGSTITVRNLSSGQPFRAQVTGRDQVVVGGTIE